MKYAFVRKFNPLYDFFLTRYFQGAEIQFDDQTNYSELAPRLAFASSMKSMSPEESLFYAYGSSWRMHPEVRPTYYHLFDRIVGGTGWPNVKILRELEKKLPADQGKLVFSMDEAASAITEFYRKQVRIPLKRGIREDTEEDDLVVRFFTHEEIYAIPGVRTGSGHGGKEFIMRTIQNIVSRIDSLIPETVNAEIQQLLEEHRTAGSSHLRVVDKHPRSKTTGDKLYSCTHSSEWVQTSGFGESENVIDLFLEPIRGFENGAYDSNHEWNYIAFPTYYVVEDNKDKNKSEIETGSESA